MLDVVKTDIEAQIGGVGGDALTIAFLFVFGGPQNDPSPYIIRFHFSKLKLIFKQS